MKSFLPNDIKDENRKIILNMFLHTPEMAKVEISNQTTMSFVTVSKIIDFFHEINLIQLSNESRDGTRGLGRKRTIYRLNESVFLSIGIQLIDKKIRVVLVNLVGDVLDSFSVETNLPFYCEDFVAYFQTLVDRMKTKANEIDGIVIGVGFAIDGAINTRKKTIRIRVDNNIEKDYDFVGIVKSLEQSIGLPVFLENDVNAATVAELNFLSRNNQKVENLVNISVGEGIGAGIIINNSLYRGINACAGELEYMCFDVDYQKSSSSIGWLEDKINYSRLQSVYNLSTSQGVEVCVDYLSRKLALAIVNIMSILDIEHFILSGKSISVFSDRILEMVKKHVEQYVGWLPVISISFEQNSSALGAAILSLKREMNEVLSK